jgi:hypothetical protein
MTTYDHWKTSNSEDEFLGPEPPPCERGYAGRVHDHPRFPSGDCCVCGALCTDGCKHSDYEAWAAEEDAIAEHEEFT